MLYNANWQQSHDRSVKIVNEIDSWFSETHIGIQTGNQLFVALAFLLGGRVADFTLGKSGAVTRFIYNQ